MIKSMTGYGKVEFEVANAKVTIELKSLNSKMLDLSTRIAPAYREKDIKIRKLIAEQALRGKVEFSLSAESLADERRTCINRPIVKAYLNQLKELSPEAASPDQEGRLLAAALRLPDALKTETESSSNEEDWTLTRSKINEALQALDDFRSQEGLSLDKDLRQNIDRILQYLKEVEPFEKQRIDQVKQRLNDGLSELEQKGLVDSNRLEQELIFYIERLDINEEKVRLSQHCTYFLETMSSEDTTKGKKLGFIAQEIGREINTLGSKSNESNMQRLVVQMKDALEKIKEQVLNVL